MPKLRVFVAGHNGMVGSALVRLLKQKKIELILKDKKELNLLSQIDVQNFFNNQKIDQIYLAAAKVGGIYANSTYPSDFIYQNLMIQNNIIHSAFLHGVKKLLFLGSSCIYPVNANQPIKEDELLSGRLEPTNEPYAIAKIAGIKMCESYNRQYSISHGIDYRSIMPSNIYGPGDNYHPENSHVIPGMIYRFHQAKINKLPEVTVWGTGTPKREFLYVDDMARACLHLMNIDRKTFYEHTSPMCGHVNVGSGKDLTIKELAETIKEIINYNGKIIFDITKPDGTSRKLLDPTLINKLNFKSEIGFKEGLLKTYKDYIKS
tara:strand:+ start:561 stop:1517 length:957 start_codon:yes stop_codon:yes gene_type:complete